MSQQEEQEAKEQAPEVAENTPIEEKEKEETDPSPPVNIQAEVKEEPTSLYEGKPKHMNTIDPNNDYKGMGDSNEFQKKNTIQSFFNHRNTFHARSTDRRSGIKHYARLSANWDKRFHVSPSINNRKSHTFYKQFFGKPTR